MRAHVLLDFIQKKINSFLFRFVLISYSLFILFRFENEFHLSTYLISILAYFILYVILLKHSKVRLLNDFLFICFILYKKNPNEVINFVFIILPIINSINFSGQKKSFLLYLLTSISYLAMLCIYSCNYNYSYLLTNLYPLCAIIFLWVINLYTALRIKIRNFREELSAVVDNFYLKKEEIKQPHKIYKGIIEVIHKNVGNDLIKDIICFTVTKGTSEKLVIVNGSSFVWQFKFSNGDYLKNIRDKMTLVNESCKIETNENSFNLSLYTKVEEQEYIFVFITESTIPLYYQIIGFFRTLEPSLSKVSRVLLSEKKLQELRIEEITKLSERSQYVNRANKTMHFMRNRLGPFANLIKMLDDIALVPSDKIDSFKTLLKNENERSKIELKNITERATDMLEKSNNPFVYTTLNKLSLEKVYTILKKNYVSFFPENELIVNVVPSGSKKYVMLNEEGFELFLSDWLNNMLKYKKNDVSCEFFIDGETLVINFHNDYNSPVNDMNQMISDLTSDDRNEIMKRTTHGLYTIKVTLEDMKIPFEVVLTSNQKYITLKLKLKTIGNENSNL